MATLHTDPGQLSLKGFGKECTTACHMPSLMYQSAFGQTSKAQQGMSCQCAGFYMLPIYAIMA